jgi:hypothetical protein
MEGFFRDPYSVGSGVFDKLGFSVDVNASNWQDLQTKYDLLSPSEAMEDKIWSEDFIWLVRGEETEISVDDVAISFINENRQEYQLPINATYRMLFVKYGDVNNWSVFWGDDERLNYLAFSQG